MSLELAEGENPREATAVFVKLRGEEYDALVQAAQQYGVNAETFDRLHTPALKHNNGMTQFLRLLVQGEVSPADFDPIPATESPEGNRFAKLEVALMPAEIGRVENSLSDEDVSRDFRNTDRVAQKLRQGVVVPFVAEVTA